MWQTILDFLFSTLSNIGNFSLWLFEKKSLKDAYISYSNVIGGTISKVTGNNNVVASITSTIKNFFNNSAFDWADNIQFAPIDIISTAFLTAVLIFGVIRIFNIFE